MQPCPIQTHPVWAAAELVARASCCTCAGLQVDSQDSPGGAPLRETPSPGELLYPWALDSIRVTRKAQNGIFVDLHGNTHTV